MNTGDRMTGFNVTVPSVIVSIDLAALNGYALSFWRSRSLSLFCVFDAKSGVRL